MRKKSIINNISLKDESNFINELKKKEKLEKKTLILLGIFICALVLANILGTKITTILGISVSVGIFAYPLTFICTDVVAEVRGKKISKYFIKAGMIALIITFFLVALSIFLPPADRFIYNDEYKTVFSNSLRMIIASMIAFLFSQYHDVWAFHFWKRKTKGKFLWFRNNFSTVFSQLIDTTLFMFIAFYMVTPQFDVSFIIQLIIPYWLFKVLLAAIDTPFVYLGVKWLRK
jgi:queuosine precursor transporter